MARTTRSGRTFRLYPKLPSEVRMMINDEMDVKDMCRFSRCSRVCQKEVQKSEKCIYGLTFNDSSDENLKIIVQHDTLPNRRYKVIFQAKSGKKCLEYYMETNTSWEKMWSINLDISTDLVQLAIKHFKKLLNSYQKSIKLLEIIGRTNYDFEIRSLKSLRNLYMNKCVDNIVEVISRKEKPLKYFTYKGEMNAKFLEDYEYIYQVQERLTILELKLNADQLKRMSAKNFRIHIGELNPNDIANFIKSYQNGEVCENFRSCMWSLADSDFEVQQLWGLLRVTPTGEPDRQSFKFEHNLKVEQYAYLTLAGQFRSKRIVFVTFPLGR